MGHGSTGVGTGGVVPSAPPLEILEDAAPEPRTAFGRCVVPVPEVSKTHAPTLSVPPRPIQTYAVSLEQAAKPYIDSGIFSEKELEVFASKHGEKPLAVLLCAEEVKRRLEQACPLTEKEDLNEFLACQYQLHRTEVSRRFKLMQQQKALKAKQVWLRGNEIETIRFVEELAHGKNGAAKELKQMLKVIGDAGFTASVQHRLKECQKNGFDPITASALLGGLVQQYQRAVRRT